MRASRFYRGNLLGPTFSILLVLLMSISIQGQDRHQQVLLLYDEDKTLPGLSVLDQSLRSTLSGKGNTDIQFFTESMNLSQFPDDHYEATLRDYYLKKYQNKKLDLIVAVMGPSLGFLLRNGDYIFPGVPAVFCGADAADMQGITLPPRVTGLVLQRVFAPTVDVVLRLQPETRNLFVIGGNSPFDTHLMEQARTEFQAFDQKVTFTYLSEKSVEDILTTVADLPSQSVVLFVSLFRDGEGRPYVPHDVISRISSAANAPVYIFTDQYLGRGAVGGHLYSIERLGELTGELGLRILGGESPAAIPVQAPSSRANMFDARQLARWGIDESRLPEDSIVRFREPSVWQRYERYIFLGGALLAAQSLLIAALLVQRTRRRRAEAELRGSFERIRNLGGKLLSAQESERAYFARELHDDVSQQMVALQFDLQKLKNRMNIEALRENDGVIAEAATRVASVTKSLRDLSHRLHPAHLRLVGLEGAFKELQRELATADLPIDFVQENVPDSLSPDIILCFYRVGQEALINAIKHSRADRVSIRLVGLSSGIALTIVDNGVGFNPATVHHGLGLLSMRERVEQIGGSLRILSEPGKGTRLEVEVPYGPREAVADLSVQTDT